jgi:hypothetical protein
VGAAVSVLGWVLVGLAVWLVLSVATAVVLSRLMRANRHTTLDVLRVHHRLTADSLRVPGIRGTTEPRDLPAPRSGAHDEAEAATHRRRPRG